MARTRGKNSTPTSTPKKEPEEKTEIPQQQQTSQPIRWVQYLTIKSGVKRKKSTNQVLTIKTGYDDLVFFTFSNLDLH